MMSMLTPPSAAISQRLQVGLQLAKEAGSILLSHFGRLQGVKLPSLSQRERSGAPHAPCRCKHPSTIGIPILKP